MTVKHVALAVLAGVVLLVGGWYAYWAIARAATSNRYDVNTNTQQYQAGLISQERDRIAGYMAATDTAQKQQIAAQFCAVYPSLKPPPPDLVTASANLCH